MEEARGISDGFRQDLPGESSPRNLQHENHSSHQVLVEKTNSLKEHHQVPPPFPLPVQLDQQQPQHQPEDRSLVVHDKILFHQPNQQQQQEGPNQEEQERQKQAERNFMDISMELPRVIGGNEGLNERISQENTQRAMGNAVVEAAEETQEKATKKLDHQKLAAKRSAEVSAMPEVIERKPNDSDTANASKKVDTTQPAAVEANIPADRATTIAERALTCKKAPKRPRAKPGFGLRTSRTTIVETGQKRRSCICTNTKLCNELMTRWAKVSPPNYHCKYQDQHEVVFSSLHLRWNIFSHSVRMIFNKNLAFEDVQLPREHNPVPSSDLHSTEAESHSTGVVVPGKTNTTTVNRLGESSRNNNSTTNMSDTDIYKNGFRYATLRNMQAKNPLPKDERVALCHYHPEVRPYLFWPKNTPSAQKYAIPLSLAIQLGYDTVATKCQGFNMENFCYAVPTYSFEDAKAEIGSVEKAFNDRVSQIKTNPTQFVRDLRQYEEELKEVHKLRRRNTELLRRLDNRRRSIKRLKSVLKVQRHATKEAQQQQLVAQAVSANTQVRTVSNTNTIQQYQQHAFQTTTAYQQQQQLVDPSQQQQAVAIPQPLGQQNHNQFFQPPPPTQEQQAIGIVVGGLTQSNEHQHEQQHHWTFTQYNANAISGPSGSENEQQHSQQQVELTGDHPYDPTQQQQQHDQQHQQQPVPSPMDDHNNPGNSFSYAQQLEAAMAAAVAAGFKDDQEDVDHHQHHGDIVGDVVDLDDLDHHDDFGGDDGEDDDLEDDNWSDTEQYRQVTGGGMCQNHQRPRKWPRKTVVLPPVSSSEIDVISKRVKRSTKTTSGNKKKRSKTTKSITTKTRKIDSTI